MTLGDVFAKAVRSVRQDEEALVKSSMLWRNSGRRMSRSIGRSRSFILILKDHPRFYGFVTE
jgi:hypothetical protein